MLRPHSFLLAFAATLCSYGSFSPAVEITIDFETAEIGKPVANWSDKDIRVELAHAPTKSKAKGRITFFPHLGTERKGVLNAMADEAIPLRITFARPVASATIVCWGSTTSGAVMTAFNADGVAVDKDALDQVPVRETPEENVPFFDLSISGPAVVAIEVSGAEPGGYVAVDELRFEYDGN